MARLVAYLGIRIWFDEESFDTLHLEELAPWSESEGLRMRVCLVRGCMCGESVKAEMGFVGGFAMTWVGFNDAWWMDGPEAGASKGSRLKGDSQYLITGN